MLFAFVYETWGFDVGEDFYCIFLVVVSCCLVVVTNVLPWICELYIPPKRYYCSLPDRTYHYQRNTETVFRLLGSEGTKIHFNNVFFTLSSLPFLLLQKWNVILLHYLATFTCHNLVLKFVRMRFPTGEERLFQTEGCCQNVTVKYACLRFGGGIKSRNHA